jgi:hypothetical protein
MRQGGIGKEPEYRRKQQDAAQQRDLTKKHEENVGAIIAVTTVIDRVATEHQANRDQKERHEKEKTNRENMTNWVLGIAAAVAILTIVVTHCDNINVTVAANRAWLAPLGLSAADNFKNKEIAYTEITLEYKNAGRSPATKTNVVPFRGIITLEQYRDKEKTRAVLRDLMGNTTCDSINPDPHGRAIFGGRGTTGIEIGFEKDLVAKIFSPDATRYALVAACFAYETMNEIHRSQFCGILEPRTSTKPYNWISLSCLTHNEAD